MKRMVACLLIVLLFVLVVTGTNDPRIPLTGKAGSWADSASQTPCPPLPTDVTAKQSAGYGRGIDPKDQQPFDEFSWQTFVALNCPANTPQGATPRGQYDNVPRVWETYLDAEDLFLPNQRRVGCPAAAAPGAKVLRRIAKNAHIKKVGASILEAVGGPLIDRNRNFTLYEIKLNSDEVKYVKANNLQTLGGQFAFKQKGTPINFPAGPTPQFGNEGAIEVKASWRILDPASGDRPERFYTRQAIIYVDAADTDNKQPLCIPALVGLVGLHIIHKTNNFKRWIWSTFEQIDNVPDGPGQPPYSYYSPDCVAGPCYPPNTPPTVPADKKFKWASSPPYAKAYSPDGEHGTQVYRSVPIYGETEDVNKEWRAKVAGTVWQYYQLIGSQWSVPLDQPTQPIIGIPAVLGNTSLETYIQPGASCVNCHHDFATTAFNQPSDFSFVLGMVPLLKSKTATRKR